MKVALYLKTTNVTVARLCFLQLLALGPFTAHAGLGQVLPRRASLHRPSSIFLSISIFCGLLMHALFSFREYFAGDGAPELSLSVSQRSSAPQWDSLVGQLRIFFVDPSRN